MPRKHQHLQPMFYGCASLVVLILTGCGIPDRLSTVGKAPDLSAIINPATEPGYTPVSMPMPEQRAQVREPNSLWQGARSFFKDQRANKVGDIMTVLISIQDKGRLNNKTTRQRNSQFNVKTPGLAGLQLSKVKPGSFTIDQSNPINITNAPSHVGEGNVDRAEEINLKVAAVVTQILPNGVLVIKGRQEVRVNYEVREIMVSGLVRKEDILSNNTISYDKIAEARVSYGGRGQLTDVQQPPYGQQVLDTLWPF